MKDSLSWALPTCAHSRKSTFFNEAGAPYRGLPNPLARCVATRFCSIRRSGRTSRELKLCEYSMMLFLEPSHLPVASLLLFSHDFKMPLLPNIRPDVFLIPETGWRPQLGLQTVESLGLCAFLVTPNQVSDIFADVLIGSAFTHVGRHEVASNPARRWPSDAERVRFEQAMLEMPADSVPELAAEIGMTVAEITQRTIALSGGPPGGRWH